MKDKGGGDFIKLQITLFSLCFKKMGVSSICIIMKTKVRGIYKEIKLNLYRILFLFTRLIALKYEPGFSQLRNMKFI